jgi:hypothetical protein
MTLLAVGDSVSFGYELSDLPATVCSGFGNTYIDSETKKELPLYPSQLAYPQLLANRLNTDCKNLSLVGGSNDRIFRVTCDQVLQQRYDLVVCSWTGLDRFDFTYKQQDIALTVRSIPWQSNKFPWFKSFVADHYDPNQMTQRFFSNVLCLQALLKQLEQPYIFVNGVGLPPMTPAYQHYIDSIDLTRYAAWGTNLQDWCRQQQLAFGPQGHFLEAGHQHVATRLYAIVKELYH